MDYDDQLTVRVSGSLSDDVEAVSEERGERKSETIRTALQKGLEQLEDQDAAAVQT